MLVKAAAIWVVGLLTLVPYGTYYLFFESSREQYALLITLVLFWIFGYWGVVGPLLAAVKVRSVFRAIELARSKDDLVKALQSPDTRDVAIELIASENHIPRFLATRVYDLLAGRISERIQAQGSATSAGGRTEQRR
ncbi:MAG TPA: hypothetical protein VGA56_13075 [Opitutaceae bacterium]|jgi:hypothetical protein